VVFPFVLLACAGVLVIGLWQRQRAVRGAESVAWQQSIGAALATAKAENRPVLVSFTSPTCGYCRQMDADVLPNPVVQAAMKPYVPVRVNIAANPDVAMRYGIQGVPAYIVTDAAGQPQRRADGFQSVAQFTSFLQSAAGAAGG
jgi:thiol:disulfide interchange protein DsbD